MKNTNNLQTIKNSNTNTDIKGENRTKLSQDEFQILVNALGCLHQEGNGLSEELERHHQAARRRQRKFRAMLGEDLGPEFITEEETEKQDFRFKIGSYEFN